MSRNKILADMASQDVTAAEFDVLDGGITSLGTVTTGSIAGGSITDATTFPTGHILRTFYVETAHSTDITFAGGTGAYVPDPKLTIEGTNSTSDYLLVLPWVPDISNAGNMQQGCAVGLKYSTSSTFASGVGTFGSQLDYASNVAHIHPDGDKIIDCVGSMGVRANHPTTSTYYIRIWLWTYSVHNFRVETENSPMITLTAFEIKG